MNVSRPQSVNHGKPAMIVWPRAAAHDVGVGGAIERRKRRAARRLDVADARAQARARRRRSDRPRAAR